jgi:hypothetical protein
MKQFESLSIDENSVVSCYSGIGSRMFDDDYLTWEVSEFLWSERQLVGELLDWGNFEHLIEGGCGFGRSLPIAHNREIVYDGCEIVKSWISVANKRIALMNVTPQELRVTLGSVESIERIAPLFARRPSGCSLLLLPFNLIGNLANPIQCLKGARAFGCSVAIASFGFDTDTTNVRLRYYAQCGFTNLDKHIDTAGSRITGSQHLNTVAYRPETLENLAGETGFSRIDHLPIAFGTVSLLRP